MELVAEETLREILLRLPTRDLARSSCVSRLWRAVVADPSFGSLHAKAAHVVSGPGGSTPETLLVTEIRGQPTRLKLGIHNVSSMKPMCRVTDLAGGYRATNACNGFICLASDVQDWPVYVCNPVTGDKLKVPPPPKIDHASSHMYAMGFSDSTHQYKLFRLSFSSAIQVGGLYLQVCTLGAHDGWRQHPHMFPYRTAYSLHPQVVLVGGKLHVLMEWPEIHRAPDRMLVIDVASEAYCTYRLPDWFTTAVHAFEMREQLWVAVAGQQWLRFWAMHPLEVPDSWELCYSFYMDYGSGGDKPRGAWFDDGSSMLCYRLGDHVYKYDTTNKRLVGRSWEWDQQLHRRRTNGGTSMAVTVPA